MKLDLDKIITRIYIKRNVNIADHNHKTMAKTRKGVLVIEFFNGSEITLDLKANADISNADYIEVVNTPFTREKTLFENALFSQGTQKSVKKLTK